MSDSESNEISSIACVHSRLNGLFSGLFKIFARIWDALGLLFHIYETLHPALFKDIESLYAVLPAPANETFNIAYYFLAPPVAKTARLSCPSLSIDWTAKK